MIILENGRVPRICETCEKDFQVVPSVVKIGGGRFCSHPCYGEWLKTRTGDKAPRWAGGGIKRECQYCGSEFISSKSIVEKGNAKFCSWDCQHKGHTRIPAKTRVDCTCLICGRIFSKFQHQINMGEGKCCSRECAGIYRSKYFVGENSPNWLGGKSFEPYPTAWKETLREAIRERDNRLCVICNAEEKNVRHSVHHIDYDKSNLDPKNLISLCTSCHSKTNYRRDEWQLHFIPIMETIYA